jgi:hypothetical protein
MLGSEKTCTTLLHAQSDDMVEQYYSGHALTPNKERPTIYHAADLLNRLCDIHYYGHQHLDLDNG